MAIRPPNGKLYVVATPIGNLQDISARAKASLQEADIIFAEDTRRARKLLSYLEIHKPLESFHGDSHTKKLMRVLRLLQEGKTIAYMSESGTPGIADPSRELVAAATGAGAQIVPIPGPCALIAALSVSGMMADRFIFGGFPPRQPKARRQFLKQLHNTGLTAVLYEAPHRLCETLQDIAAIFGSRPVFLARELTKQFEEMQRGTAAELLAEFRQREPVGEFVLVIAGTPGEEFSRPSATPEDALALKEAIRKMLSAGMTVKEAAQIVADLGLMPRREAYQLALRAMQENPMS